MRDDSPIPDQGQGADSIAEAFVDDLFAKINHDFRWPKPSEEAVATALHAIQRLAADVGLEGEGSIGATKPGIACPKCGVENASTSRFCSSCGSALNARDAQALPATSDQHIYHHHYHHHHFETGQRNDGRVTQDSAASSSRSMLRVDPVSSLRKLAEEWTSHCKANRLEEMVELYSAEAIILHPHSAPARGRAAIRQLLQELLESGLREVELSCSDTGLLGEIACLTASSSTTVPLLAGGHREESGKHLIVVRLEAGKWHILAHAWSIDLISQEPSAKVTPISPRALSK